jgi:nitrous-oxide reductase
MTAVRSHFTPEHVEIKKGDHVTWHITNVERAYDATHGFASRPTTSTSAWSRARPQPFEFEATQDGVFSFYCTEFCSALHLEMTGYLFIQPRSTASTITSACARSKRPRS